MSEPTLEEMNAERDQIDREIREYRARMDLITQRRILDKHRQDLEALEAHEDWWWDSDYKMLRWPKTPEELAEEEKRKDALARELREEKRKEARRFWIPLILGSTILLAVVQPLADRLAGSLFGN